jgi:DtxR family manganese transport transcriptional regulator
MERAEHFKEVRQNRLAHTAEDYTELIADLINDEGQARVCDLARLLGISHVSVLKTIKKLTRDRYVKKDAMGQIQLTAKGRKLASFAKRKHLVLTNFLLKLGVPEQTVATDVEGIEHYISPITLEAIDAHLNSL